MVSKASARHKNLGKDPKNIAAKIAEKHARNREINEQKQAANLRFIEDHGLERLSLTRHRRILVNGQTVRKKDGSIKTKRVEVLEPPSATVRRYLREQERSAS